LRILLTIHDFLPRARAGSELYTYYLAQELRALGHAVHILHTEWSLERGIEERGLDGLPCTVILKPCAKAGLGETDEQVEAAFRHLLQSFRPDVVHVNHLVYLSTNLCHLSREQGVPVVFTLHDCWLACARMHLLTDEGEICTGPEPDKCTACLLRQYRSRPTEKGLSAIFKHGVKIAWHLAFGRRNAARCFRRRTQRMAEVIEQTSLFIAPSHTMLELLHRYGIPREKMVHCKNGMPTYLFDRLAGHAKPETGSRRLRVGFVGALTRHKGIDVLLRAFESFYEAELTIYGRADRGVFEAYASVFAQENVHFQGVLHDEQKAEALRQLDVMVVPSVCYENSPLVIEEAFLAGVPVVTSNLGGMAELVPDNVCGLQFRVGDWSDLRAKISYLSANPAEVDRLRQNLPEVKSIAEQAKKVVEIYQRIVAELSEPAVAGCP
jgi:glycosyltransferase involved in cell wall biosynthesis